MKINIIIFCLSILLFSCNEKDDLTDTIWIGDHFCEQNINNEIFTYPLNTILSFSNDSMKASALYNYGNKADLYYNKAEYWVERSLIITQDLEELDTFPYKNYNGDSLIFKINTHEISKKIVFQATSAFNLASKKESFRSFLKENSFIRNDTSRIEFNQDGLIITPSLYDDFNNFWFIDTFKNELFLFFDDRGAGTVFHISHLDTSSFSALTYFKNDKKWKFQIRAQDAIAKENLLVGKWRKTNQPNIPKEFEREGYSKQKILIQSDQIIINDGLRIDTLPILLNREKDILYVGRRNPFDEFEKWLIIRNSDRELIIKRRDLIGNIETVSYSRI